MQFTAVVVSVEISVVEYVVSVDMLLSVDPDSVVVSSVETVDMVVSGEDSVVGSNVVVSSGHPL